jgi:hypothetical protein
MRTKTIAAWLGAALLFVAAAANAQTWAQLPGAAHDIGVGANGTAWVIGTNPVGGGFGIYRYNAASKNWDTMPGGAVRIDVDPQGNPWVVNDGGNIYRWTGGNWQQMPGAAKDVGIGANGTVWVIGTNAEGGGFGIYRWNSRINNWDKIPGSAMRIDVDPAGNAWVVNNARNIYRYNGSAFVQTPGQALDIGVGGDGTVYVVGTDNGVYRWDGGNWQKGSGVLSDISVDGKGNPYGVNPGKQIFASGQAAPTPIAVAPPAATGPTGDKTGPLAGLTSTQRGAALRPDQAKAVLNWIGARVASDRQGYCWKQSYGRGVGTIPTTCDGGKQNQAGLCYTPCNAGYGAAGPVCWQNCPSGYTDTGALCHYSAKSLTASLVRSGCHVDSAFGCIVPRYDCPSGYTNAGLFCALNTPSVPAGYSGLTGLDLTKKSYGRGAGTIPTNCAGKQNDAGLCYSACNAGMYGVGPVCWQNCPAGKVNCGAGCASSTTTCVSDTANMVVAPIMVAVNIATAGSTGAVSSATVQSIKNGLKVASTAGAIANASYQAGQTTYMWVNDYVGNFRQLTNDDINNQVNAKFSAAGARWVKEQYAMVHLNMMAADDAINTALNALNAASGFDPTGVSGVVSAFAKPICSTDSPFPAVNPLY